MYSRLRDLNRHLKGHDRHLYAQMDDLGKVHLYRRRGTFSDYVFSLTDNWTIKGSPRDWGIDPILNRLRAHDLAHNPDFFDQLNEMGEKIEESKRRDFSNSVESFMYDFRSEFAKATNDINTSCLEKIDSRHEAEKRSA